MRPFPLSRALLPALVALATALALLAAPAGAAPVCTDLPRAICGDRVVPEPRRSLTYLSFAEFTDALEVLEAESGGWLRVGSIGDSVEGRPLVTTEVTNPEGDVPLADRRVVYLQQGIHANEPGGREGMIRVIEDVIADAAGDADLAELFGRIRLVQVVGNTDGWVSGDLPDLLYPGYTRENANGVDLNRQFPWPGYIPRNRQPVSQPESQAIVADVAERRARGEQVTATADVHGMIQDDAAVWTMLSSGQFDLGGMVRQVAIGERIEAEVEDQLSPHALFTLGSLAGDLVVPHKLTTSSEFQGGLSGSGFLGDWLAQSGGLDAPSVSTIELFFNNGPAGTYNQATFVPEVVQIHVDSVRAILRAMTQMAVTDLDVAVDAGRVAYVTDPAGVGDATPMRFFDDLAPYLTGRLTALDTVRSAGALSRFDTVVVPSDRLAGDPRAAAALRTFAERGGNVVLTDSGLTLLEGLDPRLAGTTSEVGTAIGNASFTDREHPLAEGVRGNTLHTYEPSTLGYNTETGREAPVWRVEREAFEAAGGETVATTSGETSIGELALGAGTVRFVGGLLPPPTDRHDPAFGLASYAPNDTGYQVFLNSLGADVTITETR